jgi:glycosyltransferase involved in cell wall biosynthesis
MQPTSHLLDVLIPTYQRPIALATTLAGLFGQEAREFGVVIADQSHDIKPSRCAEVETIIRAFAARRQSVEHHLRSRRRGLAEQRDFLLGQATAPYVLFVDDDILLEPDAVGRMLDAIRREACGFVGMAPIGLSHVDDVRPHEQEIEFWDGPVQPEQYFFDSVPWRRHKLHNAANPLHLGWKHAANGTRLYKVAWIGACVMFDRAKLLDVGGYSWWSELPDVHCGEDVLAELLVMRKYGGCGILPSGAYHLELPTTVTDRTYNTNDLICKYLDGGTP